MIELTAAEINAYDHVLVAFSGGKDSLGALLKLFDLGVDRSKIELHHHDVDGGAEQFMDWKVTPAYCHAVADTLGLPLYFSYKEGGFEREMNRDQQPTAPIIFQGPRGMVGRAGGKGPQGTRQKFPQVSPDLSVRWCSAYLKIDVFAAAIRNQDRFLGKKTLVITGERAEESASRAKYQTFEPHRTDTRDGTRKARHVDHWRPVHNWTEAQVWDIIKAYGIVPHVAYQIGWGRLSCLTCIFGSPDQWATIEAVFPEVFWKVAEREQKSGATIQRKLNVVELAAKGTPYAAALAQPELVEQAKGETWTQPVIVAVDDWKLPAGAFGENAGPT